MLSNRRTGLAGRTNPANLSARKVSSARSVRPLGISRSAMLHRSPSSMSAMGRPFEVPPLGVTTFTTNCPEMSSGPAEFGGFKLKSFRAMKDREFAIGTFAACIPDGRLTCAKEPSPPAGGLADDP